MATGVDPDEADGEDVLFEVASTGGVEGVLGGVSPAVSDTDVAFDT